MHEFSDVFAILWCPVTSHDCHKTPLAMTEYRCHIFRRYSCVSEAGCSSLGPLRNTSTLLYMKMTAALPRGTGTRGMNVNAPLVSCLHFYGMESAPGVFRKLDLIMNSSWVIYKVRYGGTEHQYHHRNVSHHHICPCET